MSEGSRRGRLIEQVLLTHGRIVAARRGVLDDDRVTGTQSIVLTSIVNAPEPPTVSRIARSLGYSRQAIQRLVDGLADLGYLAFEDNPHHRKAKLLVATADGLRLHSDARADRERWADEITRDVSLEDLLYAADVLRRVRRTIEARSKRSVGIQDANE